MPCLNTCGPSRPCGAPGCVNSPPPTGGGGHGGQPSWSRANARIGVGYNSAGDLDMEVHADEVIRGQQSVHLGAGNRAGRDLRARVYGNTVEPTRELRIGVGNVAGGRSDLFVWQNDLRGNEGSVDIGVGSHSSGTINIVVAGNRLGAEAPHPEDGGASHGNGNPYRERCFGGDGRDHRSPYFGARR